MFPSQAMTHLEGITDSMRVLPNEIQRLFHLVLELDKRIQELKSQIERDQKTLLLQLHESAEQPNVELLQKIRTAERDCFTMTDEKIAIIKQARDIVVSFHNRCEDEARLCREEMPADVLNEINATFGAGSSSVADDRRRRDTITQLNTSFHSASSNSTYHVHTPTATMNQRVGGGGGGGGGAAMKAPRMLELQEQEKRSINPPNPSNFSSNTPMSPLLSRERSRSTTNFNAPAASSTHNNLNNSNANTPFSQFPTSRTGIPASFNNNDMQQQQHQHQQQQHQQQQQQQQYSQPSYHQSAASPYLQHQQHAMQPQQQQVQHHHMQQYGVMGSGMGQHHQMPPQSQHQHVTRESAPRKAAEKARERIQMEEDEGVSDSEAEAEGEGEAEEAADDGEEEADDGNGDNANNNELYCKCRQKSYGEMIFCENNTCPFQWFHFECVGLKRQPKGHWYCDDCMRTRPPVVPLAG